jgi:exopolysaccharide biosynthesis polyprenyl glycosylphosphotransferase
MIPSKRFLFKYILKIFDVLAILASFAIASVSSISLPPERLVSRILGLQVTLGQIIFFVFLLIVWHAIFIVCELYISKRLTNSRVRFVETLKATAAAAVALAVFAHVFRVHAVDFTFVAVFWACCTSLMVAGRLVGFALVTNLRRRGVNNRYVLVVGTNRRALNFADEITRAPELGYQIAGFVDDDWSGLSEFEQAGRTLCCRFTSLADFLRHNVVDEAAIFLPLRSYYEHAAELIALCEQHGILIRFDTQIFNFRNAPNHLQDSVESDGTLLACGSVRLWQALVKRTIDLTISAVLLVALMPLFLVVAILIRLNSPGPFFFSQTRVGLNKRRFLMYKFRTMVLRAEEMQEQLASLNEMSGPAFKMKHDPRVTTIGRILRKTSIDELPQLFNVFMGQMSLVGPRAMSLRDYQLFENDWQRRRFSVKPGITCLWQVNGRNSIPFEKWMELDMQYIDKWSLWLDMKILAQTVPAVIRGSGAA